jgi:hypothetical protein
MADGSVLCYKECAISSNCRKLLAGLNTGLTGTNVETEFMVRWGQNWDGEKLASNIKLTFERAISRASQAPNQNRAREGSWIFTSLTCFSLPWSPLP